MSSSRTNQSLDQTTLLQKMLALESRKGFRDTAVSGGFERYFAGLPGRSQGAGSPTAVDLAELSRLFEGYGRLEIDERERRVNHALQILRLPARPSDSPVVVPKSMAPKKASTTARAAVVKAPTPARIRSLDDPVTLLRSVGEGRARQLAALEVRTIRDLIHLLPRQHKDYSRLQPITSILFHRECTIRGEVVSLQEERTKTGKPIVEIEISDGTGRVRATWLTRTSRASCRSEARSRSAVASSSSVGFSASAVLNGNCWMRRCCIPVGSSRSIR